MKGEEEESFKRERSINLNEIMNAGFMLLQDCWDPGLDGGVALVENEGRGMVSLTMGQMPSGEAEEAFTGNGTAGEEVVLGNITWSGEGSISGTGTVEVRDAGNGFSPQ